jgi:hypothetical protein
VVEPEPVSESEIDAVLKTLPRTQLDPARAESIRQHAHVILVARRRPLGRLEVTVAGAYGRVLEPVLVSGLAAAYLLWAVRSAVFLYGWGG